MIIETETDFATLAAMDAESRELTDLPSRAEVEGTGKPSFVIDSEESAGWVLRKIAAVESEAARVKANADTRLAELKADRDRLLGRFGPELESWARTEAERRRRKTITLLDGVLSLRTVPGRFALIDTEAAYTHARTAFPDLIVQAAPALDAAAYVKAAQETGEQLPGLEFQAARESFSVKTASGKGGAE